MRARPPHLAFKTALKNSQPFAIDGVLQFAGARRDSRQAAEEYILLLLEPGRRRPLTRRMYGSERDRPSASETWRQSPQSNLRCRRRGVVM